MRWQQLRRQEHGQPRQRHRHRKQQHADANSQSEQRLGRSLRILIEERSMKLSSRSRVRTVAGGLAAVATVALAAAPASAAPSHRQIKTVSISLGRVLAASNNHVLYVFELDTKNKSHCDASCRVYWPPVKSRGAARAAAHVSAAHLGLTHKGQVTYYGHPLYFYSGDTAPKQAMGQGSTASGGEWYVVGTSGKAIEDES